MRTRLVCFALVAIVAVAVGIYRAHHDRDSWEPDMAIYIRMMLHDRGMSLDDALSESNRFMLTTPEKRNPSSAGFYGDHPPQFYRDQFALYRNRPLYPLVGAALYSQFGPYALKVVSCAAYVAAVLLMYVLLTTIAEPVVAVLGALGLATAPAVLNFAGLAMTDELALCFWIGALGALYMYLLRSSPAWLAFFVLASALLAFTRPAIYLPLGAALAAWVLAPKDSSWRRSAGIATLTAAAIAAIFLIFNAFVHGPSLLEQVTWQYGWQQATHGTFTTHSIGAWWALSVVAAIGQELVVDIYKNNALYVIVLAGFGFVLAR